MKYIINMLQVLSVYLKKTDLSGIRPSPILPTLTQSYVVCLPWQLAVSCTVRAHIMTDQFLFWFGISEMWLQH